MDEVVRVLELFDTRYWDFTAKHFHEKLVAEHDCERSYNCGAPDLAGTWRMRVRPGAARTGASVRAVRFPA